MNQILVTEKLYVTPELKRKKKIYKINFIISIILVLIISTIFIYTNYERNKSEQVSEQILANIKETQEEAEKAKEKAQSDVLTVVLNNAQEDLKVKTLDESDYKTLIDKKETTENGYSYYTIAKIEIPKLNLSYPIIEGVTGTEKETEELLKMSPCKLAGPEPNEKGNFCIVGHNYRNQKFFSKVPTLEVGEKIIITDYTKSTEGNAVTYEIYNEYTVVPEDISCLEQKTKGKKEITLITCTDDGKQRFIVKAKEV